MALQSDWPLRLRFAGTDADASDHYNSSSNPAGDSTSNADSNATADSTSNANSNSAADSKPNVVFRHRRV